MAKKAMSKSGAGTSGSMGVSTQSSSGFGVGAAVAVEASKPAAKPVTVSSVKPSPTREQIAKRAYEIWVAKGRVGGKDLENWQQAERELRAK